MQDQDIHSMPSVGRRQFITLVGGGVAVAGLTACGPDGPDGPGSAAAPGALAPEVDMAATDMVAEVSFDDRAESIVPQLAPLAELSAADAAEVVMTYVPEVPPRAQRSDQRIVKFGIDVIEGECPIDPANGVSTMMWGFRIAGDTSTTCGSPGPVMRARVGDLAQITVSNLAENLNPHNIDWHAVTGQGGGAEATTVAPGESATINCRLLYPGVFMYHCAFGDVPMHITHGMYGMFIVDPEDGLPEVDHEWAITQSEWYLTEPGPGGVAEFDPDRLLLEHPTYVTFNGRTDALIDDNSLQMEVGHRARIYMVNEGLNLASNFHPIGSHWDVVYPEAATHPVNRVIRGSQSTLVVAGGGTVTELVGYVPSTIILVDHALVRTFYKGCIGKIVVSGDESPIFSVGDAGLATAAAAEPKPEPQDPNTVIIPVGAWEADNADIAYTPSTLTVPVGTTALWQNNDTLAHTVTSGASNATAGTPDGVFDSGNLAPGASWSYTFDEVGMFPYYCTPHPWMIGTVEVTA